MTDSKREVWVWEKSDGTPGFAHVSSTAISSETRPQRYVPATSVPEAPEPAKVVPPELRAKPSRAGEKPDECRRCNGIGKTVDACGSCESTCGLCGGTGGPPKPEPAKASGWIPVGERSPGKHRLGWFAGLFDKEVRPVVWNGEYWEAIRPPSAWHELPAPPDSEGK